jgi:hypothetical protein
MFVLQLTILFGLYWDLRGLDLLYGFGIQKKRGEEDEN